MWHKKKSKQIKNSPRQIKITSYWLQNYDIIGGEKKRLNGWNEQWYLVVEL